MGSVPHSELSWWLWGMEFYFALLQRIWEGDKKAPYTAYDMTLSQHHTKPQRWLAAPFLRVLPNDKDTYLTTTSLVLEPEDRCQASELINREMIHLNRIVIPFLR